MLYDPRQQRLIIDRCWSIYDLITKVLTVPLQLHIEFPSQVQFALLTGYFQIQVELNEGEYLLYMHEEYDFLKYELVIKTYSYGLLDKSKNAVMRADSLPHHQKDYKGHMLKKFPHHLHDERGRICSFSGQFEYFLTKVAKAIDNV